MYTDRAFPFLFLMGCSVVVSAQAPPPNPLLQIKRICVEKFSGEESSTQQVRAVAIASIFAMKQFAVTENCDKADAILKGAVAEREDQRTRAEGEGAAVVSGSGTAHSSRAIAARSDESLFSSETKRQASVSMRLVSKDGDVLWAFTQDSLGAKSKLAISDAVDRAVKQFAKDLDKLNATNAPK